MSESENIKIRSMPNPELINVLFEKFHLPRQYNLKNGYSSHWKSWSSKTLVKIENGDIKELYGRGFGNFKNPPGWSNKLMGNLNYLTYFPTILPIFPAFIRALNHLRSFELGLLTFDSLRHAATVAFIEKWLKKASIKPTNICMIGDGHGVLGMLIKKFYPDAKLTFIDIGNTLVFCSVMTQKGFPNSKFQLVENNDNFVNGSTTDFRFVPAEYVRTLKCKTRYDLFVNISSMQEMTPEWISWYFDFIRKTHSNKSAFYCSNRKYKKLPGGEESIFDDYPWLPNDRIMVDGEPEHQRWFFTREKGYCSVKFGKINIPLLKKFDGEIKHRLILLGSP